MTQLEIRGFKGLDDVVIPLGETVDIKVTDDFLEPLFKDFYQSLGLPQLTAKRDYYLLADYLEPGDLDAEGLAEVRERIREVESVALLAKVPRLQRKAANLPARGEPE